LGGYRHMWYQKKAQKVNNKNRQILWQRASKKRVQKATNAEGIRGERARELLAVLTTQATNQNTTKRGRGTNTQERV
jgi:hypothetical protein